MRKILAFDPGGTTGWAALEYDIPVPPHEPIWRRGHLEGADHQSKLWNFLMAELIDTTTSTDRENSRVVVERFDYRNDSRPGLELISREYIGVIKLFCQRSEVILQLQTPVGKMGKKTFVKKENIQRLGLYNPGMKHAMDATAHLLNYIVHGGNKDFDQYRLDLLKAGWK
jgi:hypothetical protein